MAEPMGQGCPKCQHLEAEVKCLKACLAESEAELAKAKKHSGNSSKPPSSDITAPPTKQSKNKHEKRKRGGQHGHKRHERAPFTAGEIQHIHEYRDDACPCCGGGLIDVEAPAKIQQQVEIETIPLTIEEHRRIPQWCGNCEKTHFAQLPENLVKAGLFGPRLTALVGFLKGPCHMSFSVIRKFFRDVIGVPVSRGMLAKLMYKVSDSLQQPYDELLGLLPLEAILNVDETGHKDNGKRMWTWCFRASLYTLFKISPSRGSKVLIEVLGKEFNGVLGCDYFSAYHKYMNDFNVTLQFCLAHLIRDVKFLVEHPNADNRVYGERLLEHLRKLFSIIHRRDDYATQAGFQRALERVHVPASNSIVTTS